MSGNFQAVILVALAVVAIGCGGDEHIAAKDCDAAFAVSFPKGECAPGDDVGIAPVPRPYAPNSPFAPSGIHDELLAASKDCFVRGPITVTSTSPSVVAVSGLTAFGSPSCGNDLGSFGASLASFSITTGQPGKADLVIANSSGAELGRATIDVEATARLELQQGWTDAAGPTILTASQQLLHVTTIDAAGDVTAGTGSVHFSLTGPLSRLNETTLRDVPGGDEIVFIGMSPGTGTVDATCVNTSTSVTVNVIDANAVTDLTLTRVFPGSNQIAVTASANGRLVFGAQCEWSVPPDGTFGINWIGGGWIGESAPTVYDFVNVKYGFTETCTLVGSSLSASIEID